MRATASRAQNIPDEAAAACAALEHKHKRAQTAAARNGNARKQRQPNTFFMYRTYNTLCRRKNSAAAPSERYRWMRHVPFAGMADAMPLTGVDVAEKPTPCAFPAILIAERRGGRGARGANLQRANDGAARPQTPRAAAGARGPQHR